MVARRHGVTRHKEDNMATIIFLSLCAAVASFMLCCLYHFRKERRRGPGSSSHEDSLVATAKMNVAPVHLGGPASIATWSYPDR
jgi:hypothetical protein